MSPISVQIGQAVLPLELPPVPLALPLDVVPELPGLLEQPRKVSANNKVTRETLKVVSELTAAPARRQKLPHFLSALFGRC